MEKNGRKGKRRVKGVQKKREGRKRRKEKEGNKSGRERRRDFGPWTHLH